MQQSNAIFAALLIAYLIFITLRGELQSYIALLKGNGAPANTSVSAASNPLSGALSGGQKLLSGALSGSSSTPAIASGNSAADIFQNDNATPSNLAAAQAIINGQ